MKRITTILMLLMMVFMGAWAQITVGPSTGTYMDALDGTDDNNGWARYWKSTAKASDMTTPMLVLTGESGMNTSNGDIYSNQTYTLEAPSGYTIVSYSFNGTATDGDVTITPNGGSGTLISSGNSLGSPLSVAVGAQSTTFALSGSGHISSLALTVKVEHYIVTYSTGTGSYTETNGNGTWASKWVSTATDPQVTFSVGANNIATSTGYIYSGASTATYTLTAQAGYIITGYEIVGTAQTAAQTLTPAAGGSATTFATSGTTTLTVSGLSTASTTFTQSTPNNGIAITSFNIYLEKDPCTVTYVISDGSGVIYTSDPIAATSGETITTLPSSLQRPYCTYSVTSTTIVTGENTVPVTLTAYNPPFTVSSDFASATWYYATLRNKQLRADESAKDASGRYSTNSSNERTDVYKWAFVGNPYQLSIINKGAGNSKVLYAGSQPVMQAATPASDNKARWVVSENSNGGFTVRSESGANLYINDASNSGNLGYWNSTAGANDGGSNWLVTEVSVSDKAALGDALTIANSLYTTLNPGAGKLGYPTTAALSTFNTAISTAQGVYDDASGDYYSAYTTLTAAIATLKAAIIYTPRTDVYYTIVNTRGAMVYDSSHSGSTDNGSEYLWFYDTDANHNTALSPSDVDDQEDNNLWGFIEQDGHYYMYNVGKQQFASVGTGTYGSTWIFSDTPSYITLDDGIADEIAAPKMRVRATVATTGSSYTMSVSNSYTGPIITYDANGDGGVPMLFTESSKAVDNDVTDIMVSKVTNLAPYFETLQGLIDQCDAITTGSGLNQYTKPSGYDEALSTAKTVVADEDATQGELQSAISDLTSAIDGLTLNLPGTGFYRIRGGISNKYLASGFAANSKFPLTDATDATTIFYYDGTKLTNLSTGLCNGVDGSNWQWVVGANASTVTFHDGHTNGGYGIQTATAYFYDNGDETSSADRGTGVNMSSGNTRYRSWYLTEVTTLPVTISSAAQYATLCAPVALTIPSGVKAYTGVVNVGKNWFKLAEVETTIPANTPVVLMADPAIVANTTYNFVATTSSDFSGSNDLAGYSYAINKTDGDLVLGLSNTTGVIGFYALDGTTTLAGFKAYLPAANVSGARSLTFIFDDSETTGINSLDGEQSAKGNSAIYDLQGRKVANPSRGLYIINGKKVIIK